MKIFVCLDEVGGMTFNKRRQSSDCVIREDMLSEVGENFLYVNEYSAKQFTEESDRLIVTNDCLEMAGEQDYVFVENVKLDEYISKVEQIIVYRWQRKYPADFFFDVDLADSEWDLLQTEEMQGNSHEMILKEIYIKNKKILVSKDA